MQDGLLAASVLAGSSGRVTRTGQREGGRRRVVRAAPGSVPEDGGLVWVNSGGGLMLCFNGARSPRRERLGESRVQRLCQGMQAKGTSLKLCVPRASVA